MDERGGVVPRDPRNPLGGLVMTRTLIAALLSICFASPALALQEGDGKLEELSSIRKGMAAEIEKQK